MGSTMFRILAISAFVALAALSQATGLQVTLDPEVRSGPRLKLAIQWQNSWRNSKNHDAAWIAVKYRKPGASLFRHAPLVGPPIPETSTKTTVEVVVPEDRVG